jgi:hypothetical protein
VFEHGRHGEREILAAPFGRHLRDLTEGLARSVQKPGLAEIA